MSNEIGKCNKCGAEQFLFYGTCNYNGVCNGKVIPIKTTREQAIHWWNNLQDYYKYELAYKNISRITDLSMLKSLTGSEIEEIWSKDKKEVKLIPKEASYRRTKG